LTDLVVLISGQGTNLQALIDAARAGEIPARVRAVFSDRPAAPGLERARAAGIDAHHFGARGFPDRAAYDTALAAAIEEYHPDLVVLAGFMRVLGPELVRGFAGRLINIHPSLLPRFRGLDTHRRVLDAGDALHGATVHFVTNELDAGPRIIQYQIVVREEDTAETLAQRVHAGEYVILPRAVRWFAEGRLRLADGAIMLDGKLLNEPVLVEGDE
jgi:phosphoribosylglycinamide formyltransferase 1